MKQPLCDLESRALSIIIMYIMTIERKRGMLQRVGQRIEGCNDDNSSACPTLVFHTYPILSISLN